MANKAKNKTLSIRMTAEASGKNGSSIHTFLKGECYAVGDGKLNERLAAAFLRDGQATIKE